MTFASAWGQLSPAEAFQAPWLCHGALWGPSCPLVQPLQGLKETNWSRSCIKMLCYQTSYSSLKLGEKGSGNSGFILVPSHQECRVWLCPGQSWWQPVPGIREEAGALCCSSLPASLIFPDAGSPRWYLSVFCRDLNT